MKNFKYVPVYSQTINGQKTEVTEIIYKIKPILEQDIKIEPIILTGEIKKDSAEQNNFFQKTIYFLVTILIILKRFQLQAIRSIPSKFF